MRYLYASISWLLLSCASAVQPSKPVKADGVCIEKFKQIFVSEWYGASIDVVGKHITGLILFKTMPDGTTRVVFTNEAGITFFDFEFQRDGTFKVRHVVKQLNKKLVVRTLRNDFELVLMTKVGKEVPMAFEQDNELHFALAGGDETDYVITDVNCTKLIRLEQGSFEKRKTRVLLFGQNGVAPDSISVAHLNFNMKIKLRHLNRL
jgi:hypothetical protein